MTEKKVDPSKLTDFEISLLIIERDTAQFKKERIDELLNMVGAAKGFEDAERKETPLEKPKEAKATLPELTFTILKWESQEGVKLGKYEVAHKGSNLVNQWQHAFNILRNNKAVINSRFHENGYTYGYWIFPEKYPDRIFRKKLGDKP
jgi:hypothetical protein